MCVAYVVFVHAGMGFVYNISHSAGFWPRWARRRRVATGTGVFSGLVALGCFGFVSILHGPTAGGHHMAEPTHATCTLGDGLSKMYLAYLGIMSALFECCPPCGRKQ